MVSEILIVMQVEQEYSAVQGVIYRQSGAEKLSRVRFQNMD